MALGEDLGDVRERGQQRQLRTAYRVLVPPVLDRDMSEAGRCTQGEPVSAHLTLREITADDGQPYPLILESTGDAPSQYPTYDEDAA